ncbi:MAG TPA: AraC family transcriptional regulator, partial [Cytophagales bacterium]|nr:AraC family transcriptional regulator [Cytophagales bacterium]
GMTNTDDMAPLRYLIYDLDLIDNKKRYLLPLSQFRTPTWWYSNNQITAERLPKSDFNKITSINFQNCQLIGLRQTDLVTIHNLSFKKDLWSNWAIYLVCIIIYYAVYFIVILKQQKPVIERKHKISFQEKLPVQSNSNKELEKLIKYLGENYQNSELSIPLVQKETGVSESKISMLLKTKFGTTFKQYLTEIRLNEAKRLLKETDLQVAEIAYLVGFGNVSHFNRVFKTGTQLSPTNYREHNR